MYAEFTHTCHVLLYIWVPHVFITTVPLAPVVSKAVPRSGSACWIRLVSLPCWISSYHGAPICFTTNIYTHARSFKHLSSSVVDTQAVTCWTGDLLPHVWACGMSCLPRVFFLTALCSKNELTSLSVADPTFSAAWHLCVEFSWESECHWSLATHGPSTPLSLKLIFLLWNRGHDVFVVFILHGSNELD